MAEEIEGTENVEQPEAQEVEQTTEGETEGEEEQSEGVVITIDGETPSSDEEEHNEAPEWVKELRKTTRDQAKKIREYEKREAQNGTATNPVTLGPKPTLEGCDYDSEVYETKLGDWFKEKRKADDANTAAEAEAETQTTAWNTKLQNYGEAKTKLKVNDFDDAEHLVLSTFSETQQGVILQGSDAPELIVYALGTNPKRAKELASIKDPIKLAHAIGKLETTLKVTNRKARTAPEKKVNGSASTSGGTDAKMEQLRKEAAESGNYSKLTAYKKSLKKAS